MGSHRLITNGIVLGMILTQGHAAYAKENQRLYRSAAYLGRGDTGIAVADGAEAIFYNPAGLAQGTGIYKETVLISPHIEFSKNTRDLYRQLQLEDKDESETLKKVVGKPQHVGIYNLTALVFRRAALGALVSNQTNLLVSKSVENGGLETVDADATINQALTLSIAEKYFGDVLHLGVTGKYINRGQGALHVSIIDAQDMGDLGEGDLVGYGNGTGADVGMMIVLGQQKKFMSQHSLGLVIENIGGTNITSEKETSVLDDLKQTVNLGYAVSLGTNVSRFKLLADYRDVTGAIEPNKLKRIHLGTELGVSNFIGVMAGLNQGYPTMGMYFNLYVVRLDVGYYAQEMGERVGDYPDERYYVRIKAGF